MRVIAFVPMTMTVDGNSIGLRLSADGLEPASHYAYNMAECSNAERDIITTSMSAIGAYWYVLDNGTLYSNSNEAENGVSFSLSDALADASLQEVTEERDWLNSYRPDGYGQFAIGGYRGALVTVTNLNNSGVGSLRWAIEDLGYPRHIVASVSGWIDLASDIVCDSDYVSMDLPTLGIRYAGLVIKNASHVIVRNLRAYRGHEKAMSASNTGDCINVDLSDNVVIDHCITRFGVDECLSVSRSSYVTVQNCQVEEAIANAASNPHPESDHAFGTLVTLSNRVSILRNFYAMQQQRCPQVSESSQTEIANNLLFNNYLGVLLQPGSLSDAAECDMLGNVIKKGFLSIDNGQSLRVSADGTSSPLPYGYVHDNLTLARSNGQSQIRAVFRGWLNPPDEDSQRMAYSDNSGNFYRESAYNRQTNSLAATATEAHIIANAGIETVYRIADDDRVLDTIAYGTTSVAGETNVFVDEVVLGVPSADNERSWPAL